MKYGFVFPYGSAREAAEVAYEAEQAGWDGFFVWEPVWGVDAWVQLTAAAMRTERIRLGTMITPLARIKPWKLASETVALDHLSNGRVTLSVGLGATDTGWAAFGEPLDRKLRAELLDEGLEVLTGLWRGQPFRYEGRRYKVEPCDFLPPPPPVQQPRIPIWVVGAWPRKKSMQRVLKYDGLLPSAFGEDGKARQATPDELKAMNAYIQEHRTTTMPFDLVVEGTTPGADAQQSVEIVAPWAEAGATWWIEAMWNSMNEADGVRARVRQGPPRL